MSVEATLATWRLTKKQVTSTEKLFLLSCANRAGESHECWPSIKRLCADTGMDRKTIISVRQSAIDKGLLAYTGSFRGRSGQIPVMQLTYVDNSVSEFTSPESTTSPKNGTGTSPKNGTGTSPKNGTGDQSQKRDTESKREKLKEETNTHTHSVECDLFLESEMQRKALVLRASTEKNEKCHELYEQLPDDIKQEKTFQDVHDECVTHYATQQPPQMVSPQRLMSWIKRDIQYQKTHATRNEIKKTSKPGDSFNQYMNSQKHKGATYDQHGNTYDPLR